MKTKQVATVVIVIAVLCTVIGGISRLVLNPIIVPSRVYAGFAVICLLFAIAISVLPKE